MRQRCHTQEVYRENNDIPVAKLYSYSYEVDPETRWVIARWTDDGSVVVFYVKVAPGSKYRPSFSPYWDKSSSIVRKLIEAEAPAVHVVSEKMLSDESSGPIFVDDEEDWDRYVQDPLPLISLAILHQ